MDAGGYDHHSKWVIYVIKFLKIATEFKDTVFSNGKRRFLSF